MIAQDAGISLGSLSYRIGDKAALLKQLLEREHQDQQKLHAIWHRRIKSLNLAVPSVLSAVITAWLDEASQPRRVAALAGCELLLEAGANPGSYPGMAAFLDAQDAFWGDMLLAHLPADEARIFGCAIANYIRDELPFSLAAGSNVDYRLLRAATIERLGSRLTVGEIGLSAHFAQLVAASGSESADAPLPVDLLAGTKRAEVATAIASLIAEQGVAAVSHRAVAARAGVSNSSVAHYFRTRADLLDAGFGALVINMRDEFKAHGGLERYGSWAALMRSTHALALAAARDPQFVPFALDMRRRRAENGQDLLRTALSGDAPIDAAAVQSAALILVGNFLAMQARGGLDRPGRLQFEDLARLRRSSIAESA